MRISIRFAVVIVAISLLSACGYKLRGSGDSYSLAALSPLYISGLSKTDGLYRTIREYLRSSSVMPADSQMDARETLTITARNFTKSVHSVGSRGKVLEYELLERFDYKLGPSKVPDENMTRSGTIEARRIYTNPETEVLGRQHEEDTLRRDMWQQMANSLMRRLSKQVNQ